MGIDWPKAHIVFLLCWKILRKVLQEGIFDAYNIEKISQDLMIKKRKKLKQITFFMNLKTLKSIKPRKSESIQLKIKKNFARFFSLMNIV